MPLNIYEICTADSLLVLHKDQQSFQMFQLLNWFRDY